MNVCVIIPAAGRSTRFGESDKLAQDLGGRPVLVRTAEIFAKREEVRNIIVAGPPVGERYEQFRERFGPTLSFQGAVVVPGGRDHRWQTVQAALEAVPDDATHIAVHDAARPGVTKEILDRLFEAAQQRATVIPVVPIGATVKRVTPEAETISAAEEDALADAILGDVGKVTIPLRTVVETISRDNLVEVQTPQVFDAALLRRAYAAEDLSNATDDAMLVERLGETVWTVLGDSRNFKITTLADLSLMRAVLNLKAPAERPVHKRF